jgi:hypothetical protein
MNLLRTFIRSGLLAFLLITSVNAAVPTATIIGQANAIEPSTLEGTGTAGWFRLQLTANPSAVQVRFRINGSATSADLPLSTCENADYGLSAVRVGGAAVPLSFLEQENTGDLLYAVTFPSSATVQQFDIRVSPSGDTEVEQPNETVNLALDGSQSTYSVGSPGAGSITIQETSIPAVYWKRTFGAHCCAANLPSDVNYAELSAVKNYHFYPHDTMYLGFYSVGAVFGVDFDFNGVQPVNGAVPIPIAFTQGDDYTTSIIRVRRIRQGVGSTGKVIFPGCHDVEITIQGDEPNLFDVSAFPGGMVVSWDYTSQAPVGAFDIFRRISPSGTWSIIAGVGGSQRQFTDTTAAPNTLYDYLVLAKGSSGGTAISQILTARSTPAAPATISAAAGPGNGQITVSWTPGLNGASSWIVYAADTATAAQTAKTGTTVAGSPFVEPNLGNGRTRYYTVAGVNSQGAVGPKSSVVFATTGTAPAAPSGLTATPVETGRIDLHWTDNATTETGFIIQRKPAGGSYTVLATLNSVNVTSYSDLSPSTGVQYFYRVSAFNGVGTSPPSGEASATVPAAPAAPSGLQANMQMPTIFLNWADNSSNEDEFVVERKIGANGTYSFLVALPANATQVALSADYSTEYHFRVYAVNYYFGNSAASAEVTVTTPADIEAPSGLTATPIATGRIDLYWTDNAGTGTGFIIERKTAGGSYSTLATLEAPDETVYSDLSPVTGVQYFYRVIAFNAQGNSLPSAEASATVPASPAAPSALQASVDSPNVVVLDWVDNSSNEEGFVIEQKIGASGTYNIAGRTTPNVTHVLVGVGPATENYFRVYAFNRSFGNSTYSGQVAVTTPPNMTAPSGLHATANTPNSIQLQWTDNSYGEDGFVIERKIGANGTYSQVATISANTTHLAISATAATEYHFRVYAFTYNSGNSAYSSELTVITPGITHGGLLLDINFDGGTANDQSGNGNNFAAIGTPNIASGVYTSDNPMGNTPNRLSLKPAPDAVTGRALGQQYLRTKTRIKVPSGAGLLEAYPISCRTSDDNEGYEATWGMRVIDDEAGQVVADMYFANNGINFTSTFSESFPYDSWTEVEAYMILADPNNSGHVTVLVRVNGGTWSVNRTDTTWAPTTTPNCQIGSANEQSYGTLLVDWVKVFDTAPEPGLLLDINFDGGTANDQSGNGNNFAAIGTPNIASGVYTSDNAMGNTPNRLSLKPAPDAVTGRALGQQYLRTKTRIKVPSGAGLLEAYPISCRTSDDNEGYEATWGMRVIDDEAGQVVADMYFANNGINFTSTFSESFPYDTWTEVEAYMILADPNNSGHVTVLIRVNGGVWSLNRTDTTWAPTTTPNCQIGSANEQSYGTLLIDWVKVFDTAPAF